MLKRLFLLCVLLGSACVLWACRLMPGVTTDPASLPDAPLTMLCFSESASYFKRVQGYEFRAGEGKYTVGFSMANEDELWSVPVDQAWVDTLTGFIGQYGMMGWNGFSGSDAMLLDGTQFDIEFAFADGTTVHASGYGRFPANYGDASAAIDAHFMQLLPEEMRDW